MAVLLRYGGFEGYFGLIIMRDHQVVLSWVFRIKGALIDDSVQQSLTKSNGKWSTTRHLVNHFVFERVDDWGNATVVSVTLGELPTVVKAPRVNKAVLTYGTAELGAEGYLFKAWCCLHLLWLKVVPEGPCSPQIEVTSVVWDGCTEASSGYAFYWNIG